MGTESAGEGWRELVESVYGPLSEFYERIDARLREVPEDVPPVGWGPYVAALRALRDGQVAGNWEVLARFLVSPGSVEGAEELRLVEVDAGDEVEAVREAVKELAGRDERALLVAPTPEKAAELLRSMEDDPEVFSLLIETRPQTAEVRSVRTQAMPPVEEEPPPLREPGANGTIEFRPVVPGEAAVTRAEPLPVPVEAAPPVEPEEGPSAPETRVRSAALRPVGEAWRLSWQTEARLLQRGLMWLEQWPRDAAALKAVQAENLRRTEQLEVERAGLAEAIEESRNAAGAAEQAADEAEAEARPGSPAPRKRPRRSWWVRGRRRSGCSGPRTRRAPRRTRSPGRPTPPTRGACRWTSGPRRRRRSCRRRGRRRRPSPTSWRGRGRRCRARRRRRTG
ncbi:hypothetical protein [Actinomadura madurae]|uniref:hypothetical protein n=1 Tax=Actinomadura madurae TaxID=1993 RepID=UPI0020D244A6|nr:hypothetical protein [Actinomadura madurae]MCQ0017044.1 hypothetical protein [Actinomadura madurae]